MRTICTCIAAGLLSAPALWADPLGDLPMDVMERGESPEEAVARLPRPQEDEGGEFSAFEAYPLERTWSTESRQLRLDTSVFAAPVLDQPGVGAPVPAPVDTGGEAQEAADQEAEKAAEAAANEAEKAAEQAAKADEKAAEQAAKQAAKQAEKDAEGDGGDDGDDDGGDD